MFDVVTEPKQYVRKRLADALELMKEINALPDINGGIAPDQKEIRVYGMYVLLTKMDWEGDKYLVVHWRPRNEAHIVKDEGITPFLAYVLRCYW
jgi:hypothetical protein